MDLIEAVNQINQQNIEDALAEEGKTREIPEVYPGDYVRVHVSVVEGDRSRIQVFHGTVIRNRGNGRSRTFTVRRIASHGVGVERTFLYESPRVEKIEISRHNKVRRAQLYYLRERRGKAARLQEVREVNRNLPKHKNKLREDTVEQLANQKPVAEEPIADTDVDNAAENAAETTDE